jgi:hypothetical protein
MYAFNFGGLNVKVSSQPKSNKHIKQCDDIISESCDSTVPDVQAPDSTSAISDFFNIDNVMCWHCCEQVCMVKWRTYPKVLPKKYNSRLDAFLVIGVFCSWECVKGYNFFVKDSQHMTSRRAEFITLLIKRIYGKIHKITAAPARVSLKSFGGDLTIPELHPINSIETSSLITFAKHELGITMKVRKR